MIRGSPGVKKARDAENAHRNTEKMAGKLSFYQGGKFRGESR